MYRYGENRLCHSGCFQGVAALKGSTGGILISNIAYQADFYSV